MQNGIVESGELKRDRKLEEKIATLQRIFDIKPIKQIIAECKPNWGSSASQKPAQNGVTTKKDFAEDLTASITTAEDLSRVNQKLEEYITSHSDTLNQRDKRNLKKKLKKKIKKAKKNNPGLVSEHGDDDVSEEKDANDQRTTSPHNNEKQSKPSKPEAKSPAVPERPPEIFPDPFE